MTKIFLDTANLEEIEHIKGWGIIDGITTNQKIFLKEKGCNFKNQAKAILDYIQPLPVSLEGPNDYQGIVNASRDYGNWVDDNNNRYENIVIKVPMLGNGDGLRAVKTLSDNFIRTNVTACMTVNQAFLAANAGATYVSLFYNRIIDWRLKVNSNDNKQQAKIEALLTISETMKMLEEGTFKTKLIVGSIRKATDIEEILTAQPDIITIPTKILKEMVKNEMTESTLKDFENAWEEFKKYEKRSD